MAAKPEGGNLHLVSMIRVKTASYTRDAVFSVLTQCGCAFDSEALYGRNQDAKELGTEHCTDCYGVLR